MSQRAAGRASVEAKAHKRSGGAGPETQQPNPAMREDARHIKRSGLQRGGLQRRRRALCRRAPGSSPHRSGVPQTDTLREPPGPAFTTRVVEANSPTMNATAEAGVAGGALGEEEGGAGTRGRAWRVQRQRQQQRRQQRQHSVPAAQAGGASTHRGRCSLGGWAGSAKSVRRAPRCVRAATVGHARGQAGRWRAAQGC